MWYEVNRWKFIEQAVPRKYKCGYCESIVQSTIGLMKADTLAESPTFHWIFVCPGCERPTYFDSADGQHPAPLPGSSVEHVPDDTAALFEEARRAITVGAHTAAVMICRKILMHVAVEKGADKNKNFVYYVNYLDEKRYITPDSRPWIDMIREVANEATHEILIINSESANMIITFTDMLLRLVYEFPARVRRSSSVA
ncbi:MAG: DUF4145 domain-containing protein [Myxococcales bacterium]|nr:DUF4145 domain-containing protein [Myxococcales bacterium]